MLLEESNFLQYAILYHIVSPDSVRPSHFDLMFEDNALVGEYCLRTWAIETEPRADVAVAAQELAPHRLMYLDYEGPIEGNRGEVTRWDSGEFIWLDRGDNCYAMAIETGKLKGTVAFTRNPPEESNSTSASQETDPQGWWLMWTVEKP